MTTTPTAEALPPEQVPPAADPLGRPAESVAADPRVAWTHWAEERWVRA